MGRLAATFALSGLVLVAQAVRADEPPASSNVYFIAMRAPDVDPAPRFVSLSPSATDEQTSTISGCDGATYFLAPDDLAAVNAALSNNNTVELQGGPDGTAPQDSSVICLLQASP